MNSKGNTDEQYEHKTVQGFTVLRLYWLFERKQQ